MNEEKDEATVGSHESKALSYLFIYIKDSPLKTLVIRSLLETIYLRLSLVSFHCTRLHFQLSEDDILLIYSILFSILGRKWNKWKTKTKWMSILLKERWMEGCRNLWFWVVENLGVLVRFPQQWSSGQYPTNGEKDIDGQVSQQDPFHTESNLVPGVYGGKLALE